VIVVAASDGPGRRIVKMPVDLCCRDLPWPFIQSAALGSFAWLTSGRPQRGLLEGASILLAIGLEFEYQMLCPKLEESPHVAK